MLQRRSLDGILHLRIANPEIHEVMSEVHLNVCEAYQSGLKLYVQLKTLGYYWPIMIHDYTEFAKNVKCVNIIESS